MPSLMIPDEHWTKQGVILLEDRVYDKPEFRADIDWCLYKYRHFVEYPFSYSQAKLIG